MDVVSSVEKIVKLGLTIKEAVDTVRRNEEECREIRTRVLRVGDILSPLQETLTTNGSPAMSGALEDLEETLRRAHTLVEACQEEKSTICLFCTAEKQSTQLRRVQEDITQKVMLVVFATNVQLTIVLTRPPDRPIPQAQAASAGSSDAQVPAGFFLGHGESTLGAGMEMGDELSPSVLLACDFDHCAAFEVYGRTTMCFPQAHDVPLEVGQELQFEEEPQQFVEEGFTEFTFLELEAATNQFSEDNLIGRGAFATVYKGVLHDGLVVAIKKFNHPYQVPAAHIDNVASLSKLQHKNIVKFIGYCYEVIEKVDGLEDEKHQEQESHYFLVEEYMPNGNLDNLIYGSRIRWSSLFQIVQRIAQGIHYLHEQQLLHSDLKPNNILLDPNMNPKITDFGIARMLDHADDMLTRDIDCLAGTIGYMPPEYIMEGILSTKYDVYSFGVMLLEIISSMCRSQPAPRQASIEWAWMARQAGKMKELLDASLYGEFQLKEIRRCMEVGLLCTQFKPADRPAMPDVLAMLDGKKKLPTPKQPGYTKGRKA